MRVDWTVGFEGGEGERVGVSGVVELVELCGVERICRSRNGC